MEKQISHEARKSGFLRTSLVAGVLGIGALVAAGCGQTTPPSPEQVKSQGQFFTLDKVKAANGEPVQCFMYGSQSEGTNNSKSWFGFVCDFEGTATFPNETTVPAQVSTTLR